MKTHLLLALAISSFSVLAHAEYFTPTNLQNEEVTLGVTSPAFTGVRLMADVNVGPSEKRYSAKIANCGADLNSIQLRVLNAAIVISGEGLKYADGHVDGYNLKQSFPAGYVSSWMDISSLKSGGGCVTSVYVDASASTPGTTARVQVFGNFTK